MCQAKLRIVPVKIRNGERAAATPVLNPASCEVTSMMKRGGRSDQAVTQVKGLSFVKLEIMEADLVRNREGSTASVVKARGTSLHRSRRPRLQGPGIPAGRPS